MNNRIKIRFNTNHPHHIIKELIHHKIELHDIEIQDKEMIIIINQEDYSKIKKMKTIHNLQIIEYYGKIKVMIWFQRYWFLFLMICIGILLNVVLSNMIFKVEIKTPDYQLQKIVQKDLEQLGIKPFQWRVSYSKKEMIKKKLLIQEKDKIEWVEIEKKGTKYLVTIEAKKTDKEKT